MIAADHDTCFLCECADVDCTETIELPLSEYELVRRIPTHFIVRPEHVIDEVERVVAAGAGYRVVEKFGGTGFAAVAAAPRRARVTDR